MFSTTQHELISTKTLTCTFLNQKMDFHLMVVYNPHRRCSLEQEDFPYHCCCHLLGASGHHPLEGSRGCTVPLTPQLTLHPSRQHQFEFLKSNVIDFQTDQKAVDREIRTGNIYHESCLWY